MVISRQRVESGGRIKQTEGWHLIYIRRKQQIIIHFCHCSLGTMTRSSATAEKQRVSCQHGGGLGPPAHSPSAPLATLNACGRIRKPQSTYVERAVRKAHFKMNRAFKVIQGHPYWCRQESRMVCCRNVQLMPTLFLKLTKIRQRENGKFRRFQRHHAGLKTSQQETPSNIYKWFIFPETRVIDLHLCRW